VLSSHTIHVLTCCLLDAEAHADTHGWRQPPMIILLRAQRLHPTHGRRRQMDTILLPTHPDVAGHAGGITGALEDLAQRLTDVAAGTNSAAGMPLPAAVAEELRDQTGPGARLLGCWAAGSSTRTPTPSVPTSGGSAASTPSMWTGGCTG